jgi:hypothetical protein
MHHPFASTARQHGGTLWEDSAGAHVEGHLDALQRLEQEVTCLPAGLQSDHSIISASMGVWDGAMSRL